MYLEPAAMIKLHRHPKGEQLLCTFLTIPHKAHFTGSLLMSLGHLVAVCVRETLGKSCIYTYCRLPCILIQYPQTMEPKAKRSKLAGQFHTNQCPRDVEQVYCNFLIFIVAESPF